MNNINLEKFICKNLQNKGYALYCSKTYNIKNTQYVPQIYAIKISSVNQLLLQQHNLKLFSLSTQRIHSFLHKRPIIIVKSFGVSSIISDNNTLCCMLKEGMNFIAAKDVSASLEKYLTNIQPLYLIDNVFNTSSDKFAQLKIFSKTMTLQNVHLSHLDIFLNKHTSFQEKEDFIVNFIYKRSKELKDINIDKKITNYLLETWSNNPDFIKKFINISPYLSNQLEEKDLDIFNNYQFSCIVGTNITQASKILGLTTNKISTISEKLFKAIEKYHNGFLHIISEKDNTDFILQHNDVSLNKQYIQNLYKQFLLELLKLPNQKIDSDYCLKWYMHKTISDKLPEKNIINKVHKI